VHRFCRKVIGQNPVRQRKAGAKTNSLEKSPAKNIPPTLQEEREYIPGPWSRRKPGPRIANSKNL
jgi:hypothetical protein